MRQKTHKPLQWIKKNCRFPAQAGRLAGEPVGKYLLDDQISFLKSVLGPKGEIKKNAFFFGCRKIGKTFLLSLVLWYLVNDDNRKGFEVPIVSSVFEQGKILYRQLLSQIDTEKLDHFTIRKDYFLNERTQSKLHVVFNASTSNLGLQSSGAVFDEVGAFSDDSNLQTVMSGLSLSEDRPLILMASNPPETGDHFVLPLLRACEKDPDFLVRKHTLPVDKNWESEDSWCEVNPFLAEWKRTKGKRFANVMNNYRMLYRRALETKANEISFRRLQLGQSISASYLNFISPEKIKVVHEKDFNYKRTDLRWSAGLDLSQSRDFTALVFTGWKQGTDQLFIKPFLYLPNYNTRRTSQKKLFQQYADAGFISLQNKEVLDANEIFSDAHKFLSETGIKLEGFQIDPSLAQHYIEYFEKNFKVEKQKMTGANMTASIRELERIGNAGGVTFIGENDCLMDHFNNVLVSQKSKNYCLMNRQSVEQSIDGAVAAALSLKFVLDRPQKKYLIMTG